MNLNLKDIYNLCLNHHAEVQNVPDVVPNSMPIPYFGDIIAYLNSPIRILTAALNPSNREFEGGRFDVENGRSGAEGLEFELSNYFKNRPYYGWFSSFEPVLRGLAASYGGKMAMGPYKSTALHLDMCSPIATDPTWSRLDVGTKFQLTPTGKIVFESLLAALKPEIVIASVAWPHLRDWNDEFRAGAKWESLVTYNQTWSINSGMGGALKSPIKVQIKVLERNGDNKLLFVNGSAANTPFGRFKIERKEEVGRILRETLQKLGI